VDFVPISSVLLLSKPGPLEKADTEQIRGVNISHQELRRIPHSTGRKNQIPVVFVLTFIPTLYIEWFQLVSVSSPARQS